MEGVSFSEYALASFCFHFSYLEVFKGVILVLSRFITSLSICLSFPNCNITAPLSSPPLFLSPPAHSHTHSLTYRLVGQCKSSLSIKWVLFPDMSNELYMFCISAIPRLTQLWRALWSQNWFG